MPKKKPTPAATPPSSTPSVLAGAHAALIAEAVRPLRVPCRRCQGSAVEPTLDDWPTVKPAHESYGWEAARMRNTPALESSL